MSLRSTSIAATTLVLIAAGVAGATASASPRQLTGAGHGTWKVRPTNPDTGTVRVVAGRGHFSIGDATVRGTVLSPGFIASGDCSVRLRLTTTRGAVTVTGHSKRTTPPPTCIGTVRFPFAASHGSGELAGTTYRGVGRIDLENAASKASDHGTVTLTLRPSS